MVASLQGEKMNNLQIWESACRDPWFSASPFKTELTEKGVFLMSPALNWHVIYQNKLSRFLGVVLPQGASMIEIAVQTLIGVRVPDVAWDKAEFWESQENEAACVRAPMLCIEVVSDSKTQEEMLSKVSAYTAAGAKEVWLVYKSKKTDFYVSGRLQSNSSFGVSDKQIADALN
jgi:Uma2 family endonuclease